MISDKDGGDSDYNDGDDIDMLDSSLKHQTIDNRPVDACGVGGTQSTPINDPDDTKKE